MAQDRKPSTKAPEAPAAKPTPNYPAERSSVSNALNVSGAPPTAEPTILPTLSTLTVPAGESLSNAIDITGKLVCRIRMPQQWVGGNMDKISFLVGTDGITFMDLFEPTGIETTVTIVPQTVVLMNLDVGSTKVNTFIKIRMGTRNNPVSQPNPVSFVFVLG